MARLQTVQEFQTHPEAKSTGGDGTVCDLRTVGLLGRREVRETYASHIGKEANKLEEVQAGIVHDVEAVYTEYQRPDRDEWNNVTLPMLRKQNLAALAGRCCITERQLRNLVTGRERLDKRRDVG